MALCLPTVSTARRLPMQKSRRPNAIRSKNRPKRKLNRRKGRRLMKCKLSLLVFALLLSALAPTSRGAATIVIQNGNAAGVGFNDPTPVAPVGGNTGTTLGQQRLIAIEAAANKWGTTLTSVPTITVFATWEALTCDENSGFLARAGAPTAWRDFTGAGVAGTLYGAALANKQFGADIDPNTTDPDTAEIRARFNVDLGNAGC